MPEDRVIVARAWDNGHFRFRFVVANAIIHYSNLQAVRYLLVSGGNTVVGLFSIYIFKWLGGTDTAANIFGYSIGLILSFILNKKLTFAYSGAVFAAAVKFLIVFAVAYTANICTVLTLVRYGGINGYAAQALGIPPYTLIFYIGSRYFAFCSRPFASWKR